MLCDIDKLNMKHSNSCRRTSVVLLIIVVSILVVISYHFVEQPRRYLDRWRLENLNRHQPLESAHEVFPVQIHGRKTHSGDGVDNPGIKTDRNHELLLSSKEEVNRDPSLTSSIAPTANLKRVENTIISTISTDSAIVNTSSVLSTARSYLNKRYLIYLCDGDDYCYGLGDRQRGLIGVFILSEVTNRQFGIKMTAPAPFRDFYEPNKVVWDIPENELINKSTKIIKYFKTETAELSHINFNQAYPHDVVYIRTNQEIWRSIKLNPYYKRKFPKWAQGRRCNIFANAWLQLTRPTLELRTKLNELLVTIAQAVIGKSPASQSCANCTESHRDGNKTQVIAKPSLTPDLALDKINGLKGYEVANFGLVCAHVRIGHSDTLPFEHDRRNSMDSVSKVWDFLRPYLDKGHHVYLATDSDKVRTDGKILFGPRIHNIDAPLVHIASVQKGQDKRDGLKTALVEQLLLMTSCDVLMVSKSGFSMAAAYVRMGLIGFKNNFLFRNGQVSEWSLW